MRVAKRLNNARCYRRSSLQNKITNAQQTDDDAADDDDGGGEDDHDDSDDDDDGDGWYRTDLLPSPSARAAT